MAGRRCLVCHSDKRATAELMLSRGVTLRAISRRTGLSIDSLHRHQKNHLSPLVRGALALDLPLDSTPLDIERLRRDRTETLLQRLVFVQSRLIAAINQAEEDGDLTTAERLWARYLKAWEVEAKMLGELGLATRSLTVNVLMTPVFVELSSALLEALADYPEARVRAAQIIHGLRERALEGATGRAA